MENPPPFELDQVLVEYDGPQIVTLRGVDGLHLGIASDEDDAYVRWIYAPLTETELRALLDGTGALRDVMHKPWVYVVDVDHDGVPVHAWQYPGEQLRDDDLPARGALLPKAVRNELGAKPSM
ncbi:hypothetical protein [Polyangium aurulentum]|uniref:hypothetical protein n=1 Tax=Polyangium aurulentum TaxID=2567896 RepID=UPI0010AEB14A|nr:hypothetical protein [Polyangium aurulentum]UQA55249.1 hypothetical protein E8A73_028340 [Polyangium aurulentum]